MLEPLVRGVIASLLTPFDGKDKIDWVLLAAHATAMSRAGVAAVCVGGPGSELAGAKSTEFAEVCKVVVSASEAPVLASIYPDSTREALELAGAAISGGAQALLVCQPHYLFQPDPAGLAGMFRALRDEVKVPLLVSNTVRTALIPLAHLRQLTAEGLADGILQGAGDAHLLADLLCMRERPLVYSGIDELAYLSFLIGCDGVVSTLAAVFPAEFVALEQAFRRGDHAAARSLHERLLRVWRTLEHPAEMLVRLKTAAALRGQPVGSARSPYNCSGRETADLVREALAREQFLL
jgi:4-hydroxy-tetrahydrodipicolinate synthase